MAYMSDGEWYVVREGDRVVMFDRVNDRAVAMPLDVFDALVLMRYAQLMEDVSGQHPLGPPVGIKNTAIVVCEQHPSLGAEALRRWVDLPTIL